MHLISYTLQGPRQMNPRVIGEVIARNGGGHPLTVKGIPNVPLVSLIEVALAAPGPALPAERLVNIKFQRLRCVAMIDVNPQVVDKVTHIGSAPERIPVQLI